MVRIAFFGDGRWAARSFETLMANGHQIVQVVMRTSPTDNKLTETANRAGIEVYRPQNINSRESLEVIAACRPDICISVSYDQIIQKPLMKLAPAGFLNFHAGKLPLYRGRSILNWAIINGEESITITGHFIDEGIDTGDILLEHDFPIEWTDTYGDVLRKAEDAMPGVVVATLERALTAPHSAQPQSSAEDGCYYHRRGPGDEWVDWSLSSKEVYNKIRSISLPGPGARSLINGREAIIWSAACDPTQNDVVGSPGQVILATPDDGMVVAAGRGVVRLLNIEWANGERVKEASSLKGMIFEELNIEEIRDRGKHECP